MVFHAIVVERCGTVEHTTVFGHLFGVLAASDLQTPCFVVYLFGCSFGYLSTEHSEHTMSTLADLWSTGKRLTPTVEG
jgi:hypothetical protein